MEGDANTKYFHLVANGRHRKTRIFQLEDGMDVITGDARLKEHITSYYKNLFGPPENNQISLDERQTDDITQVTTLENELLVDRFSENEIKAAVFQMDHNKAPGPDGFPSEFYQVFWNLIKNDLMDLFKEFHQGSLHLRRLNFGNIILLPKKEDAKVIQQ
jgi:hypothetical protein